MDSYRSMDYETDQLKDCDFYRDDRDSKPRNGRRVNYTDMDYEPEPRNGKMDNHHRKEKFPNGDYSSDQQNGRRDLAYGLEPSTSRITNLEDSEKARKRKNHICQPTDTIRRDSQVVEFYLYNLS